MSNSFDNFNSLGFFNPYYVKINGNLKIETEFSNILDYSERMLDINSVSQILKFGFTLGDRTLISDIYKTPWMAKPNKSNSGWSFFDVPNHKEQLLSKDYIYSELYCRLQNELSNYITGKSNVGILLTGGMDSRVVAAVLSKLQSEKCFANINVYAFTWGTLDSRDVIYAKKIAQLYNWKWQHLEIDVDQVRENIEYTINTGCEFSPIHLHAMPKILENKYLDCVLAGSFGDSIGRGEYSGVKVKNLKPFENKINKSTILFNSKIYNSVLTDCLKDIKYYHEKFPQTKNYQQLEQDYQLHYMRKMLNPCMNVINKEIPVYQMFSSPEVFGFMWSLDPEIRTDDIYYDLLKNFAPELMNIPWARTGLIFPNKKGKPDEYKNKTIDYGAIIRDNFIYEIEKCLLNGVIVKSNLVSKEDLSKLIDLIKLKPIVNSYYFEDKLIWLYSLELFIEKFQIKISDYPSSRSTTKLTVDYYTRYYFYNYRKIIKRIIN